MCYATLIFFSFLLFGTDYVAGITEYEHVELPQSYY